MLRLKVGSDKLSRPEHMTHLPFLVPPKLIAMCCLAMLAIAPPVMAQSSDAAGRVKTSIGSASIVRGGQSAPAAVGALVYESDLLRTGADGQLAVMLKDDTRISLGPRSEVALAAFAYAPADGRLAMVLRVARGAMAYVSGRIAKLMPEAVRLETPTSVIGVRGTHALVKVEAP